MHPTRPMDRHGPRVHPGAVIPDGRAVSGSDDSTLRLWDHLFQAPLCFVADGAVAGPTAGAHPRTAIASSADGAVHFLSVPDGYRCPLAAAATHDAARPQQRPWIDELQGRTLLDLLRRVFAQRISSLDEPMPDGQQRELRLVRGAELLLDVV